MTAELATATPRPSRAAKPRSGPHLRHERVLLREGARLVAGMDEVGRGSLAGPVSVGVVVVDAATRSAPRGVADSKLLTPLARTALLPALRRWGLARAVGHASAAEIDAVGIIAALRLAGTRALEQVRTQVGPVDVVLLDGAHDWLSGPSQQDLFAAVEPEETPAPRVLTRVKADRSCATVAAASVLAKCERDAMMVELAAQHPDYRWDENKGYSSPDHLDALRTLGPCVLHRRSWRLPAASEGLLAVDVAGLEPLVPLDASGWPGPVVDTLGDPD
ncbi:ribonuclease HII [Cellulomonas fimi]|uniref:ribonuclease HII n=1 Tax=Cellulomonas fimi TaxID=1708 RepID=UPI002358A222|nr:ribonuclease HII [Cellulomonas fimi]